MQGLLALDESLVLTLNSFVLASPLLGRLAQFLGLYGVYLIPILWVGGWFMTSKRNRLLLLSSLLSGIIAWQVVNRIVKQMYFHARPIHTLPVQELLFQRPENSFPSDHIAFLGAIAFFFLLQRKPVGVWLLVLAVVVGVARIAVGVHYPSDILVGLVNGFIVAGVITLLHPRLSAKPWEALIRLAHKLHLG